jgi:hypothetical protein
VLRAYIRSSPDQAQSARKGASGATWAQRTNYRVGYGLDLGDGLFVFLSGLGLGFDVWDGYFGGPFFVYTEVFVLGLDLLGGLFLIGFFRFEIFPAPGIFAERGLVYRAGIDDYAGFYRGFEIDSAQARGCGLQGVEQ